MTLQELEMLKTHLDAICQGHRVAAFYLFGSQAEGHDDGFSDVDIGAVFFEPPNDTDWWEHWQRLAAVIEPLVAPKELDLVLLQCAPVLLQWQAISHGKLLYCADEKFRLNFEEKVIGEWLDFSEWLERFQQEMVAGILEKCYMLDKNVLLTQLSFVQQAHSRLLRLSQLSCDDFLANEDNIDVAQNRLRLAAESAVDMGRHIIAHMGWGTSTSYPDVFTRLGMQGVLSSSLATRMGELIRFRNTLVHRYPLVTPKALYQRVQQHIGDIGDFIQEITLYFR